MKGLVQKKKGYTFTGCFNKRELLLAMITFSFLPIPKGKKLWGRRLRPLHRAVLTVPCSSSHVQSPSLPGQPSLLHLHRPVGFVPRLSGGHGVLQEKGHDRMWSANGWLSLVLHRNSLELTFHCRKSVFLLAPPICSWLNVSNLWQRRTDRDPPMNLWSTNLPFSCFPLGTLAGCFTTEYLFQV